MDEQTGFFVAVILFGIVGAVVACLLNSAFDWTKGG